MHKILLTISVLILAATTATAQKPFHFFALGDMPYHNPEDIEKFKMLTDRINGEKGAFTIHVGDIKNGQSDCSDQYYLMIRGLFNRFRNPVIYIPGDNEWTDCHRPAAGGYDAVERLTALRKIFFNNHESLGQKPLKLRSQAGMPGFEEFVENVMWRTESITFATVHVVGSNNNWKPEPESNEEFLKRDEANIRWLAEIFSTAKRQNDAAIVLIMHGALNYASTANNGFTNTIRKLREEVKAFRKPVLLIYGDLHRLQINKPLMDDETNLLQNFTALMVFGDTEMNAVKVHADPRSRQVFSYSEYLMDYEKKAEE